jgi:hypothetical protein
MPSTDSAALSAVDRIIVYAEAVAWDMKLSPGGDSYAYTGTTSNVDALREAVKDYWLIKEHPRHAHR